MNQYIIKKEKAMKLKNKIMYRCKLDFGTMKKKAIYLSALNLLRKLLPKKKLR